jgi:hypothetical protein
MLYTTVLWLVGFDLYVYVCGFTMDHAPVSRSLRKSSVFSWQMSGTAASQTRETDGRRKEAVRPDSRYGPYGLDPEDCLHEKFTFSHVPLPGRVTSGDFLEL